MRGKKSSQHIYARTMYSEQRTAYNVNNSVHSLGCDGYILVVLALFNGHG